MSKNSRPLRMRPARRRSHHPGEVDRGRVTVVLRGGTGRRIPAICARGDGGEAALEHKDNHDDHALCRRAPRCAGGTVGRGRGPCETPTASRSSTPRPVRPRRPRPPPPPPPGPLPPRPPPPPPCPTRRLGRRVHSAPEPRSERERDWPPAPLGP